MEGVASFPMSAGPEEIAAALQRLKSGGLAAFPTETVYGLGADARSQPAVRRVFEVKGRPAHNPLIVHVAGEEMARPSRAPGPPRPPASPPPSGQAPSPSSCPGARASPTWSPPAGPPWPSDAPTTHTHLYCFKEGAKPVNP